MGFLGDEKNEIREYNDKRCCGLWLMIIGVVIILSAIWGGKQRLHPVLFTVGFVVGFYLSAINKKIVAKLSCGKSSKFQKNMAVFSIAILFPLMFILAGPFFPTQNWRMIWLETFLAVGLHFIPFYFVHGVSMLGIAALCSANAVIGIFVPILPFIVLAFIDGLIKIGFGLYLLFFSTPTKSR